MKRGPNLACLAIRGVGYRVAQLRSRVICTMCFAAPHFHGAQRMVFGAKMLICRTVRRRVCRKQSSEAGCKQRIQCRTSSVPAMAHLTQLKSRHSVGHQTTTHARPLSTEHAVYNAGRPGPKR